MSPGRSTANIQTQTNIRETSRMHCKIRTRWIEAVARAPHPDRLELIGKVLLTGGRRVEAVAHTNERSTREYTLIRGRGVDAAF
jgi:hypothetical protein